MVKSSEKNFRRYYKAIIKEQKNEIKELRKEIKILKENIKCLQKSGKIGTIKQEPEKAETREELLERMKEFRKTLGRK